MTVDQIHDSKVAIEVLENLNIEGNNILADKAHGTEAIRKYIEERKARYVIPPKSNAKEPWLCDFHLYKERHLVECFFNKLKHFRRIATRYDKLASSFAEFIYIASIFHLSR